MDWSGVDYCDVFISCLDSHSDGTHSLQSIHWWASDAVRHFSKSDEETNSSTSWMTWGWLYFLENIYLNYWCNCETILQSFIIRSKHIQMLLIVESHETGFLLRCAHPEHVYCFLPRSMSMTLISLQLAHNVICSMVCRPHAGSLVDAIILSIYH